MLKNYIKTAWRNLWKNKFFSFINILGLSLGLAIGILILMWVQDELSIDTYHSKAKHIYKMELFGGTGATRQIWDVDVAPMGPLAKQELPEVIDQVRISSNGLFSLYQYEDKAFGDEIDVFADPSFFTLFDFPLIKGNTQQPFSSDNAVVITEETAIKYFGKDDPIGKIILADDSVNLTVSGVIANFPKNSSMHVDMIMSMTYYAKWELRNNQHDIDNDFSNFNYTTYLFLKPQVAIKDLTQKLFDIHIKHKPVDTDAEYLLQPLADTHLYNADGSDKGMQTVKIFFIVAILILIIACINYVNLATAQSMLRAKEVSMRKIIGAGKNQLFIQFITETTVLFSIAAALSLILIALLIPLFNQVSGKELVLEFHNLHFWTILGLTFVGTLLASCIYPALLLSSFKPIQALKGKISVAISDVAFRKVLVVTQFVFSVSLIVGTIVITKQLNYIRSKNLGYDKEHTIIFWMRNMAPHYEAAKAEVLKNPAVKAVTRSMGNLLSFGLISGNSDWDGKEPGSTFIIHPMAVDANFLSFYNMKLTQGEGFRGTPSDSMHFILNETAIKEAGIIHPIGKRFKMWDINGTIIGVVKDFHFASMKEKITPYAFYYAPDKASIMQIKTTGAQAVQAVKAAEVQFKKYNGQYPFSFAFQDDVFNYLYQGEQREATLFSYFAGIAIFISCLGLLGLAAYTAQIRTKEIGIRKVLGASVLNVLKLIASDFLRLVVIAIVIAIPIAWIGMDKWLQSFAYKTDIGIATFVISGIIALAIAFITISYQSVRAALANPVKSLKNE